ncbi:hypothetical protein PFISCL1PPCAC_12327, partial [Pristionchus fissidentatus]
ARPRLDPGLEKAGKRDRRYYHPIVEQQSMPKGREQKSRSVCEAPVACGLRKTVQSLDNDDFRKLLEGAAEPEYQRRTRRASTTEGQGKPELVLLKLKEEVEEEERRKKEEREIKQRLREAVAPRSMAYEGPGEEFMLIDDENNSDIRAMNRRDEIPEASMEEGQYGRAQYARYVRQGNSVSHARELNDEGIELQMMRRINGVNGVGEGNEVPQQLTTEFGSVLLKDHAYFSSLPSPPDEDDGTRHRNAETWYRQFHEHTFELTKMKPPVVKEGEEARRVAASNGNVPCSTDHIRALMQSKKGGKGGSKKIAEYEIRNSVWSCQSLDQIVASIEGFDAKPEKETKKGKNNKKNKQAQQQSPKEAEKETDGEGKKKDRKSIDSSRSLASSTPSPPPPVSPPAATVVDPPVVAAAATVAVPVAAAATKGGKKQQQPTVAPVAAAAPPTQPAIGLTQSGGAVVVAAPQQSAKAQLKTTTSSSVVAAEKRAAVTATVVAAAAPAAAAANGGKAKNPTNNNTKGGSKGGKESVDSVKGATKKEGPAATLKMEEERARSRISPHSSGSRSSVAGRPSSDDQDEEFVSADEAPAWRQQYSNGGYST